MNYEKKNGRKIPSKFENPIDDIIIDFCDKLVEPCYKNNITPNTITIIRIILSFFVIYYLFFTCNIFIPVLGSGVFYIMDCLDGHVARSTDQVTVFGDYLDHFADIFYYLSIFLFIIIKKYNNKFFIFTSFLLLSYGAFVHLGLQQKNYKNPKIKSEIDRSDEELLNKLNCLHNLEPKNITWTRFFGCGTLYLFILYIIYYVQSICL
jgi:phosphatidylglycerophosphate synthase